MVDSVDRGVVTVVVVVAEVAVVAVGVASEVVGRAEAVA